MRAVSFSLLCLVLIVPALPALAQAAICLDYPASRTEYHRLEQAHRGLLDALVASDEHVELGAVVTSSRGTHLVLPLTAVTPSSVDIIASKLGEVPRGSRLPVYTGADAELGGCAKLLAGTAADRRAVIQPVFVELDEARSLEWIHRARDLYTLGIRLHLISPNPIDPDRHAQVACSAQNARIGTGQRLLRGASALARVPGVRNLTGGALDQAAAIADDGQEVLKSVKGIRANRCGQLVHSRPYAEALSISVSRLLGRGD